MTQKKFGKNEDARATLADIAREMAKPRMTESARRAAVVTPGQEAHGSNRIDRRVIRGDLTKPSEQLSEQRLDEEALSRMDDEGGRIGDGWSRAIRKPCSMAQSSLTPSTA